MRLRFRLSTLMVLIVLIASVCDWLAVKWQHMQSRQRAISHLEELSGPVSWYERDGDSGNVHGIELAGHHIDEELWNEISILSEARSVSLLETNITDDDLVHLRRFWNIRHLSLSNTLVTSNGMRSLSGLTTLETLVISNTSIDDGAIGPLTRFKNLTTLNVRGTHISTSGINRLRVALPNCRIYHDAGVCDRQVQ